MKTTKHLKIFLNFFSYQESASNFSIKDWQTSYY